MRKLVLKFGETVLQEIPVGAKEVSIGRSPDNGLVIDNPAVSHYHARVFHEEGRMMIEDFGSMNGTFVNGQRVKIVTLATGDSVAIGKHTILVQDSLDHVLFLTRDGAEARRAQNQRNRHAGYQRAARLSRKGRGRGRNLASRPGTAESGHARGA